jgi:RimJ/RimL family protein N-acetyltransferase
VEEIPVTGAPDGFATERLDVARWTACLRDGSRRAELIDEVAPILTPRVLHHLPEHFQLSGAAQAVAGWIDARDAESDVFKVRERSSSGLLGLLILASFPEPDAKTQIHVGYLLAERAWGKGFATELLEGLVRWQRRHSRPVELLAGLERTNLASARVLRKAGFTRRPELTRGETEFFGLSL